MKKIFFLITVLFIQNFCIAQETFGDNVPLYFFGYRMITTSNGVGQYFEIYAPNGTIESVETITKANFLKKSQGHEHSEANLKQENFFAKYGVVDSAAIMRDVLSSFDQSIKSKDPQLYEYKKRTRYNNHVDYLAKNAVSDLWKLRFAMFPYAGSEDTIGWTMNFENTYMPRPEQMEILQGYGLQRINDYIWGDNLFRLLKDMQDPNWVEEYKLAGKEE